MITMIHVAFTALALLCAMPLHAQDLRGIVNRYHRVVSYDSCRVAVRVDPAPRLQPGDEVLFYQAKGAVIDTADGPLFGTVSSLEGTGRFAFNTVHSVRGDIVTLRHLPSITIDVSAGVQMVTVPTMRSARVADTIRAAAWDGSTGGIIVLSCTDTLTVGAPVTAARAGFRGGRVSLNTADTAELRWAVPEGSGSAGSKGESCVLLPPSIAKGRGPGATGGGGGNARNGGGGGGANTSAGGLGGMQTSEFASLDVGGRGGLGIVTPSTDTRLLFGGGGGGGHQNDMQGTDGGQGGGIVIIRAGTLVMESAGVIDVSGAAAATAVVDGAGGGGAAGSVLLDVLRAPQPVAVIAEGGNGGDVRGTDRCYAPGGGGAGGLVVLTASSSILQSDVSARILGGRAGLYRGSGVGCPDSSTYGASPGSYGAVARIGDLPPAGPPIVHPVLRTRDTAVCQGERLALDAVDATSVRWLSTASIVDPSSPTTRTQPLDTTVTIVVEMTSARGCIIRDSLRVTVLPRPRPNLVYAATVLNAQRPSIDIATGVAYPVYRWSTGATTPSIAADRPGRYWVSVIDSNGCEGTSDTVVIRTIDSSAVVRFIVQDVTVRPGVMSRLPIQIHLDDTLHVTSLLRIDLRVRGTMLVPIDERITGTTADVRVNIIGTVVDRLDGTITVQLESTIRDGEPRRRTISLPFMGALGDSLSSAVDITSCTTDGPALLCVVDRNGRARMDSVCIQDGRVRLFDPLASLGVTLRGTALECTGDLDGVDVTCVDLLGRPLPITCASTGTVMQCSPVGRVAGPRWWVIRRGTQVRIVPMMVID